MRFVMLSCSRSLSRADRQIVNIAEKGAANARPFFCTRVRNLDYSLLGRTLGALNVGCVDQLERFVGCIQKKQG